MNHRLIFVSFGILATTLSLSPARAQRSASAGAQRRAPLGARLVRLHRGQRAFANPAYDPNYYPYYDSAFGASYADVSPTQFIQETSALVPPPAQASPARPPEALVMELRGDHWVRLTSYGPQEPTGRGTPDIAANYPNPTSGLLLAARLPLTQSHGA
jgi:hypothetical protein